MEGQNPSVIIKNYSAAQRKLDICRSERNVGPLNDFEERAHAHRPQSWHQETLTDLLDSSRNMARVRVHYKIALHQCNIILQSSFYIILQMRHPIYGILQMGHPIYGIPVPVPIKTFFWRVFGRFLSCFLLFHGQFVYDTDIFRKNRTQLVFFGRRSHRNKSPPLHRGHHRQLNK